ncbi:ABC-type lipoprotein export system ATPase subunit [Novosphingobium hassiacum]|uniref:ABC-type lipoprotein export system ATPase subunit n=1 Tax=Novosphingobium hassiacum TaxID=173676 RepID=A0A7W6EUV0_9SPHN|nr:ABC transporter ATP-binding protein [Novosphingobium hassiacum]MBB3859638.1 ABC-type lipoprotein export system ATPase subunit [Novosphingobium hassiacum]
MAASLCLPPDPEQPGRQVIVDHAFAPGLVTLITPYDASTKALLRTLALRTSPSSGSLNLGPLDLLDRFDLGRRVGTRVGQLAAGSAEAVGIAAALCVLPRILLIDDVTRHMGAQLAGRVMLAVRHQARKRGMIVIAASTDRVVEDFADTRLALDT